MSLLTLEAKLERQEPSTPWGFRMQGGKDFSSPLTIARVNPGSLAAKCGLQQGDIILKIGNKSSDTLKHKDAQDAILSYGNKLDLLLQRGGAPTYEKFNTPYIPPHQGGAPTYETYNAPYIPAPQGGAAPTYETYNTPYIPAPQGYPSNQSYNQPAKPFGANPPGKPQYGPKAVNPGDVHQQTPNPSLNNPPPDFSKYANVEDKPARKSHQSKSFQFLSDTLESGQDPPEAPPQVWRSTQGGGQQKQAVPKVVHAQFNSPIGLYSAGNIAKTYKEQTAGIQRQLSEVEVDDKPVGLKMTGTYQVLDN